MINPKYIWCLGIDFDLDTAFTIRFSPFAYRSHMNDSDRTYMNEIQLWLIEQISAQIYSVLHTFGL